MLPKTPGPIPGVAARVGHLRMHPSLLALRNENRYLIRHPATTLHAKSLLKHTLTSSWASNPANEFSSSTFTADSSS